jgi:hypothetical protein
MAARSGRWRCVLEPAAGLRELYQCALGGQPCPGREHNGSKRHMYGADGRKRRLPIDHHCSDAAKCRLQPPVTLSSDATFRGRSQTLTMLQRNGSDSSLLMSTNSIIVLAIVEYKAAV